MKKIELIHSLLKDSEYTEKIKLFFSTKSAGEDFDEYEKTYDYTELNPVTIRAIVRMVTPEALVWKQYGLKEMGAIEILTEEKYKKWFENCIKIEYKNDVYTVFKDSAGSRAIIQSRPNDIIRVVLMKQ